MANDTSPIDRSPALFGRKGWPWSDPHYCRCRALGGTAGNPHLHRLPRQAPLFPNLGELAEMAAK